MTFVALTMRPWIIIMRSVGMVKAYILADNLLVVARGTHMVAKPAKAIRQTHQYLADMGSKVAADKSFMFATTKTARDWFKDTWWETLHASIPVVPDFRYL